MTRCIEYCRTNVDAATRELFVTLDATVVEKPCLRRCGTCYSKPFVLLDGESLCAESHVDLESKVQMRMQTGTGTGTKRERPEGSDG